MLSRALQKGGSCKKYGPRSENLERLSGTNHRNKHMLFCTQIDVSGALNSTREAHETGSQRGTWLVNLARLLACRSASMLWIAQTAAVKHHYSCSHAPANSLHSGPVKDPDKPEVVDAKRHIRARHPHVTASCARKTIWLALHLKRGALGPQNRQNPTKQLDQHACVWRRGAARSLTSSSERKAWTEGARTATTPHSTKPHTPRILPFPVFCASAASAPWPHVR